MSLIADAEVEVDEEKEVLWWMLAAGYIFNGVVIFPNNDLNRKTPYEVYCKGANPIG